MQTRTLGTATTGTVEVGAIGLGEMPMSLASRPEEKQSLRTVHAALDAGVTLIDTADAYCAGPHEVGHGERLVAKALATYGGAREHVLVATKGGHLPGEPDEVWPIDGSPEHLRRACDASLVALGVEAIGLYQHHRPDPEVPYAETMGALLELYQAGKVRMLGISNVDAEQIRTARDVLGGALVSVQNQFAPDFRASEGELRLAAELGLAFLPWSPLGGIGRAGDLGGPFGEVAEAHGVSPQQVCLAWLLAKGPGVIPIPGSSRPETITDSARAADLRLSDDELARLDAAG